MTRAVGAALLLLLGGVLSAAYVRYERRRLAQTEGFLLLVREIRGQIACFAPPLSAVAAGFGHPALEACGFLAVFREAGDFAAALNGAGGGLTLDGETRAVLSDFAGGIGRSYREEQLALCDRAAAALEARTADLRRDLPGQIRMGCALILSAHLGLLLFLI